MKTSESIIKITAAYWKAQRAMGGAKKTADNPYFHSKYADLGAVMAVCKDLLNENGISILQPIMGDVVETVLIHESGEWFSSETKIVSKNAADPQAQGSAISYARRYGLQSMVFIPSEDDDAEKATNRTPVAVQAVKSEVSKVFDQSAPGMPDVTPVDLGVCRKCGAKNVVNPKTNKIFCEDKCWLKEALDTSNAQDFPAI